MSTALHKKVAWARETDRQPGIIVCECRQMRVGDDVCATPRSFLAECVHCSHDIETTVPYSCRIIPSTEHLSSTKLPLPQESIEVSRRLNQRYRLGLADSGVFSVQGLLCLSSGLMLLTNADP